MTIEQLVPFAATLCAIVKDEVSYILEWLAYHEIIGFNQILIYDNDSSDGTSDILAALMKSDKITYVKWRDEPGKVPQYTAYVDAISRVSTEWICFLDIDEFLLLKSSRCVSDFLRTFPLLAGGVAINWRMFGSSGHRTRTRGLVIERFTKCTNLEHGTYDNSEYGFSWQVKSFARVNAIKQVGLHLHELKEPFYYVNAVGEKYVERSINHESAQINHYAVKSWEEFLEKSKKNRVNLTPEQNAKFEYWEKDIQSAGWSQYFECYDLNSLSDTAMLAFADSVNQRVKFLEGLT